MQDVTAMEEAMWKGPALGQPFPSSLQSRVISPCLPPSHLMRIQAKPASAEAPTATRVARSGHSTTSWLLTHTSFQASPSSFQQLDATRTHSCLVPVKFPPRQSAAKSSPTKQPQPRAKDSSQSPGRLPAPSCPASFATRHA